MASRVATLFWGVYAVVFAGWGKNLGSLIEAVNMVGSLFYGSLLGVLRAGVLLPKCSGTAAFIGMLAGEAAIFARPHFTDISLLWYNVIGCVVVMATALTITYASPEPQAV